MPNGKILLEQCKPGQVYIYIDEQYRSMVTEGTAHTFDTNGICYAIKLVYLCFCIFFSAKTVGETLLSSFAY
jgi:hypothetical protein